MTDQLIKKIFKKVSKLENNVRLVDSQMKLVRAILDTQTQMIAPYTPWSDIVKVYASKLALPPESELSGLSMFGFYKQLEEMDTNCVRGNQRWSHTMIHNDWKSTLDEISKIKDHKFSHTPNVLCFTVQMCL